MPIFLTRDSRFASWGARLSIIVSWASVSGASAACSSLSGSVTASNSKGQEAHTAAAAPDWALRCCHRRSSGHCEDSEWRRAVGAIRLAPTHIDLDNNREARKHVCTCPRALRAWCALISASRNRKKDYTYVGRSLLDRPTFSALSSLWHVKMLE